MQPQAIPLCHIIRHRRDQNLHHHSPSWGSYKQQWGYPSVSLSQSKTNIVYSAVPLKLCPLAFSPSFLLSFGYIPVIADSRTAKSTWDEMRPLQSWIHWNNPFSAQLVILWFVHSENNWLFGQQLTFGAHLTFEDPPKSSEIHLVWTVEDHYVFSKAPSHIFHSFSFSSSCRSHRCSTHVHAQSLSQSDVTSKRQQSIRLQQMDFGIELEELTQGLI